MTQQLLQWKLIPMKSTLKFITKLVPRYFRVAICSNKEHYRQLLFNKCNVLLFYCSYQRLLSQTTNYQIVSDTSNYCTFIFKIILRKRIYFRQVVISSSFLLLKIETQRKSSTEKKLFERLFFCGVYVLNKNILWICYIAQEQKFEYSYH